MELLDDLRLVSPEDLCATLDQLDEEWGRAAAAVAPAAARAANLLHVTPADEDSSMPQHPRRMRHRGASSAEDWAPPFADAEGALRAVLEWLAADPAASGFPPPPSSSARARLLAALRGERDPLMRADAVRRLFPAVADIPAGGAAAQQDAALQAVRAPPEGDSPSPRGP